MTEQLTDCTNLTNKTVFDILMLAKNTRPALHGGFFVGVGYDEQD